MSTEIPWRKLSQHPVYSLLAEANTGGRIHADEVDALSLPANVAVPLKRVIEKLNAGDRLPAMGHGSTMHLATEFVSALPGSYEVPEERDKRLSMQGDVDAANRMKTRRDAVANLADEIMKGAL